MEHRAVGAGLESPPRETLAGEVVGVLRDELAHLLAGGAALVQFDEPGLADVAARRPQTAPASSVSVAGTDS